MNAKSRILWEIPRNTLVRPKSVEKGVIDVKYIYFLISPVLKVVANINNNNNNNNKTFWKEHMKIV